MPGKNAAVTEDPCRPDILNPNQAASDAAFKAAIAQAEDRFAEITPKQKECPPLQQQRRTFAYCSVSSSSLAVSVISTTPRDSLTIPSFWK